MKSMALTIIVILILAGAFSTVTQAGTINLGSESGIISIMMGTANKMGVLTINGEVWEINMHVESPEWVRREDYDPPMPIAEIEWWHCSGSKP